MNQAYRMNLAITTRTPLRFSGAWRASLIRSVLMLCSWGTLHANESLPLPSWGDAPSKHGVLIGVFPTHYSPSAAKGQAGGGSEGEQTREGSGKVPRESSTVPRNYQLFLPSRVSKSQSDTANPQTVKGLAKRLSLKEVVERVKHREADLPLIQFVSDEPMVEDAALRRFASFMESRLQIPLCVFLLGERQVLEAPNSWIDLVDELRAPLGGKRLVVVVGGEDEFLRLLFLNADITYLKPGVWTGVVEHSLRGVHPKIGHTQKVEQVLTRFTAEALRHLEIEGAYPDQAVASTTVVSQNSKASPEREFLSLEKIDPKESVVASSETQAPIGLVNRLEYRMRNSPIGVVIMLGMGALSGVGCLWSGCLRRRALRATQVTSDDPMQWFGDSEGEHLGQEGESSESLLASGKEQQDASQR